MPAGRHTYPTDDEMARINEAIRANPDSYHQIADEARIRFPDMDARQVGSMLEAFVGNDARHKRGLDALD